MALQLIITGNDGSKPVVTKIKDSESTSDFQFYLMVLDWNMISEIKLVKNDSNHVRLKIFENGSGLLQLIDEGKRMVHKFTYTSMKQVTNAMSLYRLNKQEFIDTFHFATMEEFEALKAEASGEINFPGSFNEDRILNEDLEKAASRNTNKAVILTVVVVIFFIIRMVVRMNR